MAESEHDSSLRSQSDNEKTRRNKRKMARPKRLAPSNDPVSLGLHDNADSETEVGDEQRATSRSKVDRAAAASISAIQNRPLDLRSSAEAIDDVIEAASRGVTVVTRQSPPSPSNALVTSDVDLNCLSTAVAMDDGGFSSEDATTTTTTDVTGYLGNADARDKARHDVIRKNSSGSGSSGGGGSNKHMTRQRRIEANARERTRVHTISAAFESLRRAVPSYAYNQRLSKLAILRIACSYIVALGRLADLDCDRSEGGDGGGGGGGAEDGRLDFAECVDICTRTIQAEGRAKRRN